MMPSIIDQAKQIAIRDVLTAFFPGVELKQDGRNLATLCPFHSEKTPSFKIDPEKNRWRCFGNAQCGGGTNIDLLLKAGLADKPLSAAKLIAERFDIKDERPQKSLTLSAYAAYVALPVPFLRDTFKLEETPTGIVIPYLDEEGKETGVQIRHRLEKPEGKDSRFTWRKGSKPCLYGVWALNRWAEKKTARVIVEGASDVQVLWFNKIPALGVPGASAFKKDWARLLLQFDEIAIVQEPGAPGASFVKSIVDALRDENYQGKVKAVSLSEKDPRDLWLNAPDSFKHTLEAAISVAEPIELYPSVPLTKDLLYRIAGTVRRFVFFKNEKVPLLIAVWIVATYLNDRFQYFAILWINSPVMRCGKSRLLELIDKMTWRSSGSTINISAAALFRLTSEGCTLLADEVENLKNSDREQFGAMMAIFNAGFAAGATVPRAEKSEGGWIVRRYPVYGPKVLAGISTVSDTIRDRSLSIRMARKSPKERTARLNMRKEGKAFDALRASLELWAEQNGAAIEEIYDNSADEPGLSHCDDRFLDITEPLLAILRFADAESANGDKRIADDLMPLLKELGGQRAEAQTDEAVGALCVLLETLLDGDKERFISSADLLEHTKSTAGLFWISSTKSLATFMAKFDFVSRRDPAGKKRGYMVAAEAVQDISIRYTPSIPEFEASDMSETRTQSGSEGIL
jgi:hypothetical protein